MRLPRPKTPALAGRPYAQPELRGTPLDRPTILYMMGLSHQRLEQYAEAIARADDSSGIIGDALKDLHTGRNAGVAATIAVLTGAASHDELAPHADAVLPSIADLPDELLHA